LGKVRPLPSRSRSLSNGRWRPQRRRHEQAHSSGRGPEG
jgi:hypothetical protein